MCRCSSPEVDMIYNKLENFPFPENAQQYTPLFIVQTPNPAQPRE